MNLWKKNANKLSNKNLFGRSFSPPPLLKSPRYLHNSLSDSWDSASHLFLGCAGMVRTREVAHRGRECIYMSLSLLSCSLGTDLAEQATFSLKQYGSITGLIWKCRLKMFSVIGNVQELLSCYQGIANAFQGNWTLNFLVYHNYRNKCTVSGRAFKMSLITSSKV